jgi:hypothetical protein
MEANSEENFLESIRLTPAAIQALDGLFDSAPPQELRENLLEIYHTYLVHAHHTLPLDFENLARNMYLLTSCLLTVSQELSKK